MTSKQHFNSKRKFYLTGALLIFIICSAILLQAEFHFRNSGISPGALAASSSFDLKDEIWLFDDYETDSFGIFRVSENGITEVKKYLSAGMPKEKISQEELFETIDGSVMDCINDFGKLLDSKNYQNSFNSFIDSLEARQSKGLVLDASDSAYLRYAGQPINDQGFRSIAFEQITTDKKKILLLGDSFTWGYNAIPFTNSFPDELAAKGFVVYNSGISGADPAQYERVVETWVPILKPDVVVVNFYYGNDVAWYERNPDICKPTYFTTSNGWLTSSPDGKYCFPDYKTAYQYYAILYSIPPVNFFNRLCRQTSLLTKLWLILKDRGWIQYDPGMNEEALREYSKYLVPNPPEISTKPVSKKHLLAMKEVAIENGAEFILVMIPDLTTPQAHQNLPKPEEVFGDLEYHLAGNITSEDYTPSPNGHFNNKGHEKYASFLDSLISKRDVNR